MNTTTTSNQDASHTNGTNKGSTSDSKKTLSPVEAISKVSKILDQLSPNDRKRVLAFVSEPSDSQD